MPNAPRSRTEGRRCFRRRSFEPPPETTALYESSLCYMRLPHYLIENPLFQFSNADELLSSLGDRASVADAERIRLLVAANLPPIVSEEALAVMLGVNVGLVWSLINRPGRHYRKFEIPKGRGFRSILAPKVAIKVVQTWLAFHLARNYECPNHVFGFVAGKSHIDAAVRHCGADWAYSVDIENFFPSTPQASVEASLVRAGYDAISASLVARLCCLAGCLPQGAPTSPVLSNMCFAALDTALAALAHSLGVTMTRYADDVVFSGSGAMPDALQLRTHQLFEGTSYRLAAEKDHTQPFKGRIKVHGLLVKGDAVRLTKGYRNKLRAYRHILMKGEPIDGSGFKMRGHLQYNNLVAARGGSLDDYAAIPAVDDRRRLGESNSLEESYSFESPNVAKSLAGQDADRKVSAFEKAKQWIRSYF